MKLNVNLLSISALLLLTACGGGDSDGENVSDITKNTRTIETSPIVLTANNVEDTSSDAVTSVFNNLALNTADSLTGVIVDDTQESIGVYDIEWALKWLTNASIPTDSVTGVISSNTENCETSGTTTTTFDVQNSLVLSPNDSITIESINCHDGGSEVTNGKFTFTFTQLVNFTDFENYSTLGIKIDLDDFSVITSGIKVNIVGSYSLVHEKNSFGDEQNITANELTISTSQYQQSIKKLVSKKVFIANTNIETLNVSNELTDELLNGSVIINTIEDFQFFGKNANAPFEGSMKITGANNSSITLTMLSSSLVELASDFNGDNVIDDTRTMSWNSLN